jgi:uncharacterized membrane protein YebE (DUF533 family)
VLKFFLKNKDSHRNENQEYFKHLVAIALHDGLLDKQEVILLCKIGAKLGLGASIIQDLIHAYSPHKILSLPKDNQERFDQLYDVICIMLADEEITEEECDFCMKLAKRLGFKSDIVGELVRIIHYDIELGTDKPIILNHVRKLIDL